MNRTRGLEPSRVFCYRFLLSGSVLTPAFPHVLAHAHRHDDVNIALLPDGLEDTGSRGCLGLDRHLRRWHRAERILQVLDVERELPTLARDLPLDLRLVVA